MLRKVSVLVVDDFPDGRDMLSEYLTFKGFSVHAASAGAEAVEIARRITPDVILMDLQMPGTDGCEATRQLKADPKTKGITVVVVTARALQKDADIAREAGCDAVIVKPFDMAVLADSLLRVPKEGPSVFDVPGLNRSPSPQPTSKARRRAALAAPKNGR